MCTYLSIADNSISIIKLKAISRKFTPLRGANLKNAFNKKLFDLFKLSGINE